MPEYKVKVKAFKKMDDPRTEQEQARPKYIFYAQANSINQSFSNWMATNPREQKMTTNTAKSIISSLKDNDNFHELNKGILFSASKVVYDNRTNEAAITFLNPQIHGNIDGGHTLRAILDVTNEYDLPDDRFVFVEVITGIESPVDLAAARNTMVPVDLKSIEELKKSFEVIKEIMSDTEFNNRIAYKMNEHYDDREIKPIDVREIISILNMFNQTVYPKKTSKGVLTQLQPVQSYSGKETSLRKFTNQDKTTREKELKKMKPIINDIFSLWDIIELDFPKKAAKANKKYGARNYSKYDNGNIIGKSYFYDRDLQYVVPKGILFPLIGAFRSLVEINEKNEYFWKINPFTVWEELGKKLTSIILEEKIINPDMLAKNSNLWSNLFKEIYIYAYIN